MQRERESEREIEREREMQGDIGVFAHCFSESLSALSCIIVVLVTVLSFKNAPEVW
jgi:hypothetical protein